MLYDADADIYLVSNINGEPLGVDDNGYISKVSPDGKIAERSGSTARRTTSSSTRRRVMAIADGMLYVADITRSASSTRRPASRRARSRSTARRSSTTSPPRPTAASTSPTAASTRSSSRPAPTRSGSIGKDGKAKALIKDKSLGDPNGITTGNKGSVWVVTFGSGEIYQVDAKGKQQAGQKLPKGQLDGIVTLDGGDVLVSSWEGSAIYRGKPGKRVEARRREREVARRHRLRHEAPPDPDPDLHGQHGHHPADRIMIPWKELGRAKVGNATSCSPNAMTNSRSGCAVPS